MTAVPSVFWWRQQQCGWDYLNENMSTETSLQELFTTVEVLSSSQQDFARTIDKILKVFEEPRPMQI
jgi:hypothetical protein